MLNLQDSIDLHRFQRERNCVGMGKKFRNKDKFILSQVDFSVHYDFNKPLVLACDASSYRPGAVLCNIMPDGFELPI